MLGLSCPSTSNEPESCSSEESSCTASSIATSNPSSKSSLSDVPNIAQHEAPPPPPLPPPPPGGPPPLPSPQASMSVSHNGRKKRRVRSFYWKPIPEEKVRGKPNIWTLAVRQQQFQIDVRSVEELFGQQEEAAAASLRGASVTTGASSRVSRSRSFKENSKGEISILDSKRGMNVGIFLKQFKKSNRSIIEDIRRGEGKPYGSELLKDLLKLLPDVDEIKKLQAFKGDPDKLTLVDSFMFLLIQVPQFEVRIEAMVLREEFVPSCAVMSHDIDVIRVATKELMNCEELHAVLHLVLQAGNIMNAGGYAGNAVGFKLSSLLSLADTKANKPGMNLLHFVAMEAKKKDEKLLKFPEKLRDVQSAARISVENIEMEFSSLYVRIKSLEEKVRGDEELQQQLEPFLQSSAQTLQDLKRRRLELRQEGNAVIDFFCEDKDTFKLDECFRIFQDFCIKFHKAVKDNSDREQKEAARQRRLKEIEEKRFAWANEDQSGVFSRCSSESDVDMLTKEGLLDFFQRRSQSPLNPLGRSASARRHRHTVNSTADRELQGYLELFGEAQSPPDYSKFNSLPRSGRRVQRRTTPWIAALDNKQEAGSDRQMTSTRAVSEPISPLARFPYTGPKDNADTYNNNDDDYSSVSDSSVFPQTFHVFQRPALLSNPSTSGQMNVRVEKHTLVQGPQAFDLPSPNNNSRPIIDQKDLVVTDLEKKEEPSPETWNNNQHEDCSERQGDSNAAWDEKLDSSGQTRNLSNRGEEDYSCVSSTTCDTPLPLDSSVSSRKPVFYIVDCTDTDCSITLDYSEVENSSVTKEDLPWGANGSGRKEEHQDPRSTSSNVEFKTPSHQPAPVCKLSVTRKADTPCVTPSSTTEEWDTESCDTVEGKQKESLGPKKLAMSAKSSKNTKCGGVRAVRTLTTSESQGMRKVVAISKPTRSVSNCRRAEGAAPHSGVETRRAIRDQSTPARGKSDQATRAVRRSSLPPDESKAQHGGDRLTGSSSRWARDSMPRKASIHKPNIKPLRIAAKPPPEEKMCRSTMRALAQAQAQVQAQGGGSSENSSSHTPSVKNTSDIPSFARNTVASSSRNKRELVGPSTLDRSPSSVGRRASSKLSRAPAASPSAEEKPRATNLRRVHSMKASTRSSYRSETPPPSSTQAETRKTSRAEQLGLARELTPSRTAKPSWK